MEVLGTEFVCDKKISIHLIFHINRLDENDFTQNFYDKFKQSIILK